jgi:hypothetical protein
MRGLADLYGRGGAEYADSGARPLIRRALARHLLPQGEKGAHEMIAEELA